MGIREVVLKYDKAYADIPANVYESLEAYLEYGHPPGDFLEAVLCNDLQRAVAHADEESAAALVPLAKLIFNRVPGDAHGSLMKVTAWISARAKEQTHASPA